MRTVTRPRTFCGLILAGISVAGSAASAQNLIGNSFDGVIYDVNQATGQATNPRNTGITNLVDIAYASDGTLYGLTAFISTGTGNALYKFDPTTGVPALVGATGLTEIFEGDLAFQPGTGTLFGIQDIPSSVSYRLFTLNTTTGAAGNIVNITGVSLPDDLSGMAFASDGTLYVLDTSNETLLTVNPATGAVTSSVNLSSALGNSAGLEFDPASGVLYTADGNLDGTDNLYTLNPTTGALALVGSTTLSNGLAGLTFAPVAIPEPTGALALAGVALTSLLARRRRA